MVFSVCDIIINFFIFSASLISFFIALGELVRKDKFFVDYLFTSSFLALSLWYLQLALFSTGVFSQFTVNFYILMIISPIAFAASPLMRNRYQWIITNRYSLKRKYLAAFIPAIISLVSVIVIFLTADFESWTGFHSSVMSDEFNTLSFVFKVSYILLPAESFFLIFMMVPALVNLYPLAKMKSTPAHPNVSRIGYIFAFLITISNLMAIIGFFFSIPFLKFSILFSNVCMTSVFLVTQRNPDYLRLLKSITRKHQYEKSQIKGLNISMIVERLIELMEDEKIFAVEDLTLGNLAGELGISGHQLSEILNREMKKNFSTFINEYRIREAKQLLIENPERSILAIGISSGFNSATTFNAAFLKAEGITPGKYRKMVLEKK